MIHHQLNSIVVWHSDMNYYCRHEGSLTIQDGQIHYLLYQKKIVTNILTTTTLKQDLPIKFKYASPPRPLVINRIILCNAIPRSIIKDGSLETAMCVYISLSINQNATVLSPTRACAKVYGYNYF